MKVLRHFFLASALFSVVAISTSYGQIVDRLNKHLDDFNKDAPKERVHILTDRDVYAPGDIIWLYASVYDLFSTKVSKSGSKLTLKISDGDNIQIYGKVFPTEEGRVEKSILLPKGLKEGVYYLSGETDLSNGANYLYRKILIRDKIVPSFVIEAEFKDAEFIPGDNFPVKLIFKDYYNEPIRNVTFRVDYFDGTDRVSGFEDRVRKGGIAPINVKVPINVKSGIFGYKVTASTKSKETTLEGKFPVLTKNIFLDFYPENGILINKIATTVHVFSYDAVGEPLASEADLLENDAVVKTFYTDQNGLGAVDLVPDVEKRYAVQLKRPLLLDQLYEFPEVKPKGVALKVVEKSPASVKYKIISGYNDPRDVLLVGMANNQIFHVSEHQIDDEISVNVPLDNIKGNIAHFAIFNAAMHVEGEHILALSTNKIEPLNFREIENSVKPRGKNHCQVNLADMGKGQLIVSAVNEPWRLPALGNQVLSTLTIPFDSEYQMVFQSGEFHNTIITDENWEKYANYYVPTVFSWDRILGTKGALQPKTVDALFSKNLAINDQYLAKCNVEVEGDMIRHSNLMADPYFTTSNPGYTAKLYQQKIKKKPAYKTMLENGTPVLNVIQAIKPYKMEGNLIIFYGSENSINFQGGALIVVDGINRGTDAGLISNISPYDVEEIFVSTNPNDVLRYTGLNNVGLIEITLKTGRDPEEEEEVQVVSEEFQSPDYDKRGVDIDEDFRSTLYWKVLPVKGASVDENIIYFNSDLLSIVKGRLYFLPDEGTPGMSEFEYTVR